MRDEPSNARFVATEEGYSSPESQYADLANDVRDAARKLFPDYPNIQTQLSPTECLWAITEGHKGVCQANNNCHEYIARLRIALSSLIKLAEENEQVSDKVLGWAKEALEWPKIEWKGHSS